MGRRGGGKAREADLSEPVKAFLAGQGYVVRGEVRGCDVVATRGDEKPVIVELKLRFNLALVLQGVERLALTDQGYLALPPGPGKRRAGASPGDRLVRRLGARARLRSVP